MKKLFTGKVLAFALVMTLALSLCVGALAYSDNNVTAYKVTEAITVDGDLSEWDTSSAVTADTADKVVRDAGEWSGAEDDSFSVYVMWDENNLYLAAKVLDDTPFMYREGFPPDMADSLVIFLSTDPNADPDRSAYAANDFRLTQIIDDYDFCNGIDRDMLVDNQGFETSGEDGDIQVLTGFSCADKAIEGGYTYESVIPWSNFSNEQIAVLTPETGMSIGFEIGMFDLDFPCPGVATVRMQACGSEDADTNPSLWGTLTFAEK